MSDTEFTIWITVRGERLDLGALAAMFVNSLDQLIDLGVDITSFDIHREDPDTSYGPLSPPAPTPPPVPRGFDTFRASQV